MVSFLKTFLQGTYDLMSSIKVPGFNVSIISVLFGACGAIVSIGLLKLIFGLGNSAVGSTGSTLRSRIRGGNNKNIKISKERKGDSH